MNNAHTSLAALQRYRAILDCCHESVLIVEVPSGQICDANHFVCRLLGYTYPTLCTLTLVDLLPPPALQQIEILFNDQSAYAEPHVMTSQICKADHTQRPVEINVQLCKYKQHSYALLLIHDIVGHQLAVVEALRESEERYRYLVEFSPVPIIVHRNGYYVFVNPAAIKMHGASQSSEILGRPLTYFIHASDHALWRHHLRQSQDYPRQVRVTEFRLTRLDGYIIDVQTTAISIPYNNTQAQLVICADVSETKRTHAALRRERDFSTTVLNTVDALVMVLDAEGRVISFNRACEVCSGYAFQEVQNRIIWDMLLVSEEREAVKNVFLSLTQHTPHNEYINYWRSKNGDLHLIHWNNAVLLNPDNTVAYVMGTGIDITERNRAEQALRESERRLEMAVEAADLGVWDWYPQTHKVIYNERWANLMGYTLDEVAPTFEFFSEHIHPDDLPEVLSKLNAHIHGKLPFYESEHRRRTKSGDYMWVLDHGKVVERDTEGRAIRAMGVYRDITAHKQADTERDALIAALEAKNVELKRFTYTISHDLKSPLVTIKGFLGYLEQDAQAEDVHQLRQDIARITNATDKMQQLLDELLELSRIGRIGHPLEYVRMSDIAQEAADLVSGYLQEREVSVYIASDMPQVYGDPIRLREVYENLLSNAAKFMGEQAHPFVEIDAITTGDSPLFFVRDNGMGIPPRYHDKIFGLFEKLDPQSEGTGIGLAIVKRIIEVHNGQIWVDSSEDKEGTTFYFTLLGYMQS